MPLTNNTKSCALIRDANGTVVGSEISSSELATLDGIDISSGLTVQDQLNIRPRIATIEKTLAGNWNGQVLNVQHGLGIAPKMVYAHISTGGTDELSATGPFTLFVFATVPLVNGALSSDTISVLIPDIDTNASTVVTITALY